MKLFDNDFMRNAIPLVIVAVIVYALISAGKQPLWAEAYRRLRRNGVAIFAIVVIGLFGVVATLDSFGNTDKKTQNYVTLLDRIAERPLERTYSAPLATMTTGEPKPQKLKQPGTHILGTDGTGQDVFYRTLKGTRTAFIIGGFTTLLSTPFALLFGLCAGYYGKAVDDIIQYIFTVLVSIPGILLQIALVMVLGHDIAWICVALGVTSWVGLCRLVRGETLKHRDREYVRAAKSLGVSDFRLLTKHILPNLLPVVIISTTLGFSGLILSEPILAYLGIGVDASMGSWGNMIDGARDELARDPVLWWNITAASVALFVLVLAFNLLGDALRDAVDPRLRS